MAHGFAAAREDCETLEGAARLASRKVGPVWTPALPLAAVEQALIDAGGSMAAAARALGIASANLRGLVRAHPSLTEAVFEQIEQEIDAAWQVLLDGLRSDSVRVRIRAATYILRHTEAGRRRGWGPHCSSRDEPVEPQPVTIKWIDT